MNNPKWVIYARYIVGVLLLSVVVPFLPLLISRHWDWWEAWAYGLICIFGFAISRGAAAWRHPDIVEERAHILQQEDAKPWDKRILPVWFLTYVVVMLVAGLDDLFDWSPTFSLPLTILSLFIFLAGYAFGTYALIENRYFSGMARIQTERGHQVVSSGPYAWVRHPGYAGSLLANLATPILLGSWWAFVPTLIMTVLQIVRTSLEDSMLQNELEGYRDYTRRVRYRLVPGVW